MNMKKYKISILATAMLVLGLSVGCSNNVKDTDVDKSAILKNENVRKAINLALDKETLVNDCIKEGSNVSNGIVPAGFVSNLQGQDYTEILGNIGYLHDDEAAKDAWAKAKKDLNFNQVELDFLMSEGATAVPQSNFIKKELEETLDGLTVTIKLTSFEDRLAQTEEGEFDMVLSGWGADYPDPSTYLGTFITNGMNSKDSGYSNKQYDKYIDIAKQATTTEESWENFAKAEKILVEDSPIAPLYSTSAPTLQKKYVKNMATYSSGADESNKWTKLDNGKKELNVYNQLKSLISLNTSISEDTGSYYYSNEVFEGLLRLDVEGKVVPGIAEKGSMSEDGLTWTFNLRKNAKWSNGENVTANDFLYAWERVLNPSTKSGYSFILFDIEGAESYNKGDITDINKVGIKVIDDYTLEVKLNKPITYFNKLTAFPVLFPQNKTAVEQYGSKYGTSPETTVYNGPYTMESHKDSTVILTKNNSYWDASAVNLDKIKVMSNPGISEKEYMAKYKKGEFDLIVLPPGIAEKYKNSSEYVERHESNIYFIMFNLGE